MTSGQILHDAKVGSHLAGISGRDFARGMKDAKWRLSNLYTIVDKNSSEIIFRPNEHQEKFYENMHWRNIVLKARQFGYSTAADLLALDSCLFSANYSAAIIAQDREAATKIFRRTKLAYDRLPGIVRQKIPLIRDSATELAFANGSSFHVATSARASTLQFLHISEFGKICAHYPEKAQEIITGSLPAAQSGVVIIESTAQGREGAYYEMTQTALAAMQRGAKLSRLDYRLHFAPWFACADYQVKTNVDAVAGKDADYFLRLQANLGIEITPSQRAWYIATRDSEFGGDWQLMKQEYPSTPEEAFEQSTEGAYYAEQLSAARRQGRIGDFAYNPRLPVNTFWDLGKDDDTVIWFHQHENGWDNWIDFFEAKDEAFAFYVRHMQSLGYVWGKHYLPHDGEHRAWGAMQLMSAKEMLEELGLRNIVTVPRTPDLSIGIRQTRDAFAKYRFDQTRCKAGLLHLEHYRKTWNERVGAWSETPLKNGHHHAADAIRQHAQSFDAPRREDDGRYRRRRVGAMAA